MTYNMSSGMVNYTILCACHLQLLGNRQLEGDVSLWRHYHPLVKLQLMLRQMMTSQVHLMITSEFVLKVYFMRKYLLGFVDLA